MKSAAYHLFRHRSETGEPEFDAEPIDREPLDNAGFSEVAPLVLPPRLELVANFGRLRETDFPVIRASNLPVMSRRALDALLAVEPFPYVAAPVLMIDNKKIMPFALETARDNGREGEPLLVDLAWAIDAHCYDLAGTPNPGLTKSDFVIVQLTSHIDALDVEASVFSTLPDRPNDIFSLRKTVLKDVPLPPLFRLSAYPFTLYVSAAGRGALEAAEIRGAWFRDIE
jgi:hypothetical protein